MKKPILLLALIPLGLWGIFALPGILETAPGFWDARRSAIVLSGLLALWWMSAGILLATRPAWLEQRFGGLDKLYRLHKYLGIGAGSLIFCHWMFEWLPKKLVKLGWIEARPRGPRGPQDFWLDLAKDVGEWAGYILLALVVVALVKRIPYRYFRWVHKLFGAVFIGGAFHGLMLLPKEFWQSPLAWTTALVAAFGIVAALRSLGGQIGKQRHFTAVIEQLRAHDCMLEIVCRPTNWPGHRAGQFVLLDVGLAGEGAHPFTLASHWQAEQPSLTLAIKGLGDFTRRINEYVRCGQRIHLEGPYGCFDFAPQQAGEAQVWIAGGIGITPFLAGLQARAAGQGKEIDTDLYYCTPQAGDFPEHLDELCRQAGVRLHRRLTDREGPLASAEIAARLKPESSVWFCGPAAWGKALAQDLKQAGVSGERFHREAFEFR